MGLFYIGISLIIDVISDTYRFGKWIIKKVT